MSDIVPVKRALISASNKEGLIPFAQSLVQNGAEILSTGGTAKALEAEGVPVTRVETVTGFPEILGGRVKTLHPLIHGGLLGRRDLESDQKQMAEHGIQPIDLVAVILYQFEKAAQDPELQKDPAKVIEEIDIGGPAMLRSSAKNFPWVAAVSDPRQYGPILIEISVKGGTTLQTRRRLAQTVFERTSGYDKAISDWFGKKV